MKCQEALQILELNREGEISGCNKRDLAEHLQSCKACAAEALVAERMKEHISSLRAITPVPDNAARLTSGVMRAIRKIEEAEALPSPWHLLVAPRFRLAMGMSLLLVGGLFLVQTERDARRVAALEERLSTENPSSAFTLQGAILSARTNTQYASSIDDLVYAVGQLLPGTMRREKIPGILNMHTVDAGGIDRGRITFEQYLKLKYPRLASVRLDDGLSREERDLLKTEGAVFLKDVEELLRKGEMNHEQN
jgi:hypothetical protein